MLKVLLFYGKIHFGKEKKMKKLIDLPLIVIMFAVFLAIGCVYYGFGAVMGNIVLLSRN